MIIDAMGRATLRHQFSSLLL